MPLFAFGGAGPVHACGVAQALGAPSLVGSARRRRAVGDRLPHRAARVRLRALGARAARRPELGGRRRALRGDGGRGADPARGIGRRRGESRTGASPTCATTGRATRSACPCRTSGDDYPASLLASFDEVYRALYERRRPARAGRGDQLARRLERPATRVRRSRARPRAAGGSDAQGPPPRLVPASAGGYVETDVHDRYAMPRRPSVDRPGDRRGARVDRRRPAGRALRRLDRRQPRRGVRPMTSLTPFTIQVALEPDRVDPERAADGARSAPRSRPSCASARTSPAASSTRPA